MKNLQIHNSCLITYVDDTFTIDLLGGVDMQQIDRMICTLRITHQNYPPLRSTLDLYSDPETDRLIRTLCDKWNLKLSLVATSVHAMIAQVESYKLDRLKYPVQHTEIIFEQSPEEEKQAKKYLSDKKLISKLQADLQQIGILEEEKTALSLFLSIASYQFSNPFSVLCITKNHTAKNYLLQQLSGCVPNNRSSFHNQISDNALYYFDNHQIDGKVLFIEDVQWTQKMLHPLSTLQSQKKLVKTKVTRDKDGMYHSTTFEVAAKLCFVGCASPERNYYQADLPFLCLPLNHHTDQEQRIMDYQKKLRAGLINPIAVTQIQRRLQCVLAKLRNVTIINPFAPLIELPPQIPHPNKTLLLLLNFMDVITYFHQYQRETITDENTGEIYIKTHPDDVALAFDLLKDNLLHSTDDLSPCVRSFYNWLKNHLAATEKQGFTALDVRKAMQNGKSIHPRTLNRYLKELVSYHYLQITGGNKHRGGYTYQLTGLSNSAASPDKTEQFIHHTLKKVNKAFSWSVGQSDKGASPTPLKNSRTVGQTPMSNSQTHAK